MTIRIAGGEWKKYFKQKPKIEKEWFDRGMFMERVGFQVMRPQWTVQGSNGCFIKTNTHTHNENVVWCSCGFGRKMIG